MKSLINLSQSSGLFGLSNSLILVVRGESLLTEIPLSLNNVLGSFGLLIRVR